MDGAKAVSLALRIVAIALSVDAAVVMGTASEMIVDSAGGSVVSYSDYSALVYLVVGSAISAVCAALALYLFVHGDSSGAGPLAVSLLDAAAQAILFSASGTALTTRGCFVGEADALHGRTGTATALGVCAAAAVSVATLTRDPPSGGFSVAFCA